MEYKQDITKTRRVYKNIREYAGDIWANYEKEIRNKIKSGNFNQLSFECLGQNIQNDWKRRNKFKEDVMNFMNIDEI